MLMGNWPLIAGSLQSREVSLGAYVKFQLQVAKIVAFAFGLVYKLSRCSRTLIS
jgi:hypothetical protein